MKPHVSYVVMLRANLVSVVRVSLPGQLTNPAYVIDGIYMFNKELIVDVDTGNYVYACVGKFESNYITFVAQSYMWRFVGRDEHKISLMWQTNGIRVAYYDGNSPMYTVDLKCDSTTHTTPCNILDMHWDGDIAFVLIMNRDNFIRIRIDCSEIAAPKRL